MQKCYGCKVGFIFLYKNIVRNIFRFDKYLVLSEVLRAVSMNIQVTSCQRANGHRRLEVS